MRRQTTGPARSVRACRPLRNVTAATSQMPNVCRQQGAFLHGSLMGGIPSLEFGQVCAVEGSGLRAGNLLVPKTSQSKDGPLHSDGGIALGPSTLIHQA